MTEHITKTPGVCGGRACIAGTRIRVQDIVGQHELRGYSPDEIVDLYDGITLANVYAALVYYFDHREEIAADVANDRRWDDYGKTQPSLLKKALGERRGA
jgi:uncharacterized protein (DUF433 family)